MANPAGSARFSSSLCPPGPTCELPFGFLWTPLEEEEENYHSDEEEEEEVTSYTEEEDDDDSPPMRFCRKCLALANMYDTGDTSSSTCVICGTSRAAEATKDSIVSNVVTYRQSITNSVPVNVTHLILVMDAHLMACDAAAVGQWVKNSLSRENMLVSLLIFGRHVALYTLGEDTPTAHVVVSADELYEGEENDAELGGTNRRNAMYATVADWDKVWTCIAAHYKFDPKAPAPVSGRPSSRLEMLRRRKEERMNRQANGTSVNTNGTSNGTPNGLHKESSERCTGDAILCALEVASPQSRTARILLFTNSCPSKGPGSCVVDRDDPLSVDPEALAAAHAWFGQQGAAAAMAGVGVDVLCSGSLALAMPAYQALVEASAGYALSMENLDVANVDWLWKRTRLSGVYRESKNPDWIDGCILDIRLSKGVEPTHLVGPGEFIEDEKGLLPNEHKVFAEQGNGGPDNSTVNSVVTRIRLGRYDPLTTFSIMLRVTDSVPKDQEYMFLQCTARYMQDATTLVTRTATHRLSIASDVSSFLDSVDEHVVPVMLGKEAVYRSLFGREEDVATQEIATDQLRIDQLAYEAQRDIDTTVHRISVAFRLLGLQEGARMVDMTEEGQQKAPGNSMDFTFPPELTDSLHRMYHLRRGPLVSPGPLQSADDKAALRSLFIRLPMDACLCMMAPSLWSLGQTTKKNQRISPTVTVPPETLVLWDEVSSPSCSIGVFLLTHLHQRILAADHYTTMFVWSGRHAKAKDFDGIRKHMHDFLKDRANGRFPIPTVHLLAEGDSMGRRFTSLLAPSHNDPVENQLVRFPELETLTEEQIESLRDKFTFHDASVDPSFRQWFWEVASASSTVDKKGVSLCD